VLRNLGAAHFFYISNHRVPASQIDRQLDCARKFFAMPQADKVVLSVSHSATMRGYEPMDQTADAVVVRGGSDLVDAAGP